MALSIRNPNVERLARELANRSGLGLTEAIGDALAARLESLAERERNRLEALSRIASACAAAPDVDGRSSDEILGYDGSGVFGEGDGDR